METELLITDKQIKQATVAECVLKVVEMKAESHGEYDIKHWQVVDRIYNRIVELLMTYRETL